MQGIGLVDFTEGRKHRTVRRGYHSQQESNCGFLLKAGFRLSQKAGRCPVNSCLKRIESFLVFPGRFR
jgi:hypothetical protein